MTHLPFRYGKIQDSVLLTNEAGQYYFLDENLFQTFLSEPANLPILIRQDLESKFFVAEDDNLAFAIDESAVKLRTKKAFLNSFTELHIIVLTYKCNSKCRYCHASSSAESSEHHVLSITTARRVCEFIMRSPSRNLKIEFQGGEPTLEFEVLVFIIQYLHTLNRQFKKNLDFVVCTNLLVLTVEQLAFYKKYSISISTSLDGPKEVHDRYRTPLLSQSNYERVVANYKKVVSEYSRERVSALLTVTKSVLPRLQECVDTYVELGLGSIFIRPLNPYGMAEKSLDALGYDWEEYLEAYDQVLTYILSLNKQGVFIREETATIFLQKILTPFSSGFVDIQSPPGTGISCAVYDTDGNVYPSDEGRMLARCGDANFCLGSVLTNTYEEVMLGEKLKNMIRLNMVESNPFCQGCPYIPYCGIDPVRIYQEERLQLNHWTCKKYFAIMTLLFTKLLKDSDCKTIFYSWLSGIPYQELMV